jgi:hypothetical protein
MTPEEIKKLLLQSKTEGLSGSTVADLQRQTADPMWRPKTAKAAHRNELAHQAVTGLQNAMGPAAMLMPSMGFMAEAAPTAIGLGAELGDVAKKGFVSNSNFDNTMLAMLGVSGMPLLGRKGEGKLYSKAVTLADEQGVNLHSMTPTFLSRWLKKNNIKPAEAKIVRESNTLYQENAKKPIELADPDLSGNIPNSFIAEDLSSVLQAKLDPQRDSFGNPSVTTHSTKFSDITFPNIVTELENQNINLLDDFSSPVKVNNVLIDPHYDTDGARYADHWNGEGPIHARIGYAPDEARKKMIGILAEVQSDAAKKIGSSELPKTTFLSDYPNIATKQGLLQLIQQSDANMPGKPLQVVWPSGRLQREVNRSGSPAYDNIYDKRVTKAMSEALGDDAVIEQLRQAPFTPIEMQTKADPLTGEIEYKPYLKGALEKLSNEEFDKLSEDARITANALYPLKDLMKPYMDENTPVDPFRSLQFSLEQQPYNQGGYTIDGYNAVEVNAKAFAQDDWLSRKHDIETMLTQHLLKQKAATVSEAPSRLFSTTIPAEKVSRLAKDGIPLWMLPIGMGISSQMSYNKESPQQ